MSVNEELVGSTDGNDVLVVLELNQGLPAEVDWPRKLSPWYCKCTRSELSLSNLMSQLVQLKSVLELSMAHVLLAVLDCCSSSSLVLHASLVVVAIVLITSQPLKVSEAKASPRCCSWYYTTVSHMITACISTIVNDNH